MKSTLDLSTIDIPYGVLHDQRLRRIEFENNKMVLKFDVELYPQNYTDDFYKAYQEYKHCDMLVEFEAFSPIVTELYSSENDNGEFKGLSITEAELIKIVDSARSAEFVACTASSNEFRIELFFSLDNSRLKPKRRYKKFSTCICNIALLATKVEWNWY